TLQPFCSSLGWGSTMRSSSTGRKGTRKRGRGHCTVYWSAARPRSLSSAFWRVRPFRCCTPSASRRQLDHFAVWCSRVSWQKRSCMPPSERPMTPLTLSAYTLVTANGRGVNAVSEALRERRSGLKPCNFEDALLKTYIGRVEGLEDFSLENGLE